MSTINGCGTGLRGWRHEPDGSSIATSWILFAFLPVVPLRRYRLRTLTDFEHESFGTADQIASALVGSLSWSDPVAIQERLPLSWCEIGMTYLRAYVLVPLLCLWPFAVFALVLGILRAVNGAPPKLPEDGMKAFLVLASANAIAVLLIAARRMRGYPGSRPRPAAASASTATATERQADRDHALAGTRQ